MITKIKAENFTAFTNLQMTFGKGINVLIGENGTGKTHIMKALYAACYMSDERVDTTFDKKLKAVFLPLSIGRLVHRKVGRNSGKISVYRNDVDKDRMLSCSITTLGRTEINSRMWKDTKINATFIPVKDMLANAPGFRSLYAQKELCYEEVYADIIDKAFLPVPRGKYSAEVRRLLNILSKSMSGKVIVKKETFYLKNKFGELEFSLLAEGFRKLGLLYTLILNGSLTNGSVLFWDEPEANLNPKLAKTVVQILLELQRMGVQIFLSTHDYVLLKELQMATISKDDIMYHTLYRNQEGDILCDSTEVFGDLKINAIDATYADILDREIPNQGKGLW